tara:strand:+ start:5747 stop:5875 length:129 start_codon:yes stop_codon:yes gene_type:complete
MFFKLSLKLFGHNNTLLLYVYKLVGDVKKKTTTPAGASGIRY